MKPTAHVYDFVDSHRLVCLHCRNHFLLVGYLGSVDEDLRRIPRELLRGAALEESGAADTGPACRPSGGSFGGEG